MFFRILITRWRPLKFHFAFCLTAKSTEARYVIFAEEMCQKHNYICVTKYYLWVSNYKPGEEKKY